MILAGGPDHERQVSLASGAQVEKALRRLGYEVLIRDIQPHDLSALDEFEQWRGDALFVALHGPWGEGGTLQRILEQRSLPFFGCNAASAERCMDKAQTKQLLEQNDLPTPIYEVVGCHAPTLPLPLVLKPICEGSSIDVHLCRNKRELYEVQGELLRRHQRLLAEQFIDGLELTVGVLGGPEGDEALPPVQVNPATGFYDYQAKYERNDTEYVFDIGLPSQILELVQKQAVQAHTVLGCRHLSRVDFMVDLQNRPWILEVNTIPGFTSHSLLPKAAAQDGISWQQLVDRLVRLAIEGRIASTSGYGP